MWIIFLKGLCVLVRVGIIHKSKSLPGTVEKNSSTIRSSVFSTVPGKDFDLCIIPTRTKTHKLLTWLFPAANLLYEIGSIINEKK